MRLLHTADWHLGKRLEDFSRLEEQKAVLEEICEIAENNDVDAILVAGDLFDTYNPPTEAIELFYKTVKRLAANGKRAVVAIAGNHDSPDRIEAPDPLARECGIFFAGHPFSQVAPCQLDSGLCVKKSEPGFMELQLPGQEYPLRILLAPYANEFRVKAFLGLENEEEELRQLLQQQWRQLAEKYCDTQGVNILLAHLFLVKTGETPPEEPEDEKPILHVGGAQTVYSENVPDQMQYVALGHLHRHQVMADSPCPMVYSSSPLSYSFSEANQQKFVSMVEVEPGKPARYSKINLTKGKPLCRKKFENIELALTWLHKNPDCLIELTLVTENYLTASDRKRLSNAHSGIVTLIPEVTNPELLENRGSSIDLGQDMEKLFIDYFEHRLGQKPNEELLALFKEIRAEQTEA